MALVWPLNTLGPFGEWHGCNMEVKTASRPWGAWASCRPVVPIVLPPLLWYFYGASAFGILGVKEFPVSDEVLHEDSSV